jgi:methyl-accepting chemotaxis protein
MATDSELRRRVTRVENETESTYELITEIRSTQLDHTRRLDDHDRRFDQIDRRFDDHDQRFDQIATTLTELTTSVNEVLRRLPEPS